MFDKTELKFNMINITNLLKEKRIINELIMFQKSLPHIDGINEEDININLGSSEPYVVSSFFFLTYAILHEFEQIHNKLNRENKKICDYFFKDILTKKEESIEEIKDYFIKKDKDKIIKVYNFSHKGFFISENGQIFTKGSEMKNNTYCYNNNEISGNILLPLLNKDIKKNSTFLIKLPSIITITIIDLLKLLSFSFNDLIIFKAREDSFLKDSFYIYCSTPHINNYKNIQLWIEKHLKKLKINIKDLEKLKIKQLLSRDKDDYYTEFNNIHKTFALDLEILIFTMFCSLIISYNIDIKDAIRRDETWKLLDIYNQD